MVGLDGLRAAAAGMIVLHHAGPLVFGSDIAGGLDVGVMLFFALSGYVLYRSFGPRDVAVAPYLLRRVARIWPAYLVAAFGVAVFLQPSYLSAPLGLLTMGNSPLEVIWTLRLELGFYCLLPLIARFLRSQSFRRRLIVLGWLACISLAFGSLVPMGSAIPVGLAVWAFVPGMIVADVSLTRPDLLRRTGAIAAAGIALIGLSVIANAPYPDFAGGIGAALLLPWFAAWQPARLTPFVAAAGGISYSVYLWHLPLIHVFGLWAIPLTVAISAVAFTLIERPCMAGARYLIRMWSEPRSSMSLRWPRVDVAAGPPLPIPVSLAGPIGGSTG
ncbi:MAG TPA: acyltransferase [Candidatus Limnocylindrales bacterium]|nr:acyltransferase [Candidatus Limnocylindrales bacterium]